MKRKLIRLPEKMLRDEAEMRAFYQLCGISKHTTELAILARRIKPVDNPKPPSQKKGRPRKPAASSHRENAKR